MKRITPKKFIEKGIILLILVLSLVNINRINAQGPNAPEAIGFEPVDATDMVNLITGDFTYVIPLLDIPSPEGGYPIALSYHAGIAVDQKASWVGLGWNINPGAINRGLIGVPDDNHNFKIQDVRYNLIDEYNDFTASVDYGSPFTLGTSLSYSTHKGFGGSVNYGLLNRIEYSESKGLTIQSGINKYNSKTGYSLSFRIGVGDQSYSAIGEFEYNFKSNSLSGSISQQASIGLINANNQINLSSKGSNVSTGISTGGYSVNNGGGIRGQVNTTFDGWTATIPIPKTLFRATLSSGKVKQFIYANETNYAVGSIAFKHDFNEYTEKNSNDKYGLFYTTDVIMQQTIPYDFGRRKNNVVSSYKVNSDDYYTEINFPAYDKYSLSSQGLSGNFSIKYFENILLPLGKGIGDSKLISSSDQNHSINKERNHYWEKSSNNTRPQFYFNNEFSSYLDLKEINSSNNFSSWDISSLTDDNNSITENILQTNLLSIFGSNNGLSSSGLHKKRTGSFIESFTKDDILNSSNFLFATNNGVNLNYSDIYLKTDDSNYSIIGFKVTARDGKTYHYSLPVYQKEMILRSESKTDPEDKFNERRNFSNYATHWLLTAITGSDYVDINSNQFPDGKDYGYWVRFEYGKWSDGFGWESKSKESIIYEDCDDPVVAPSECDEKRYISKQFGVKEIYYLNKIKTRTHTALFLKSLREDSKGSYLREGNSKNSPKVLNNVRKVMSQKDFVTRIVEGKFESFYHVRKQENLKLEKIVIIKNEDDIYYSNNKSKSSKLGGEFYFYERFQSYNILGQDLGIQEDEIHNEYWYSEFYDNMLEVDDIIDKNDLNNKSLKAYVFNYDYKLGGNLTLNSFKSLGKSAIDIVPDYKFSYNGGAISNNFDSRWGYYTSNPDQWSLNSIKTPIGAEFFISYESDSYKSLNETTGNIYNEGGIRVKKIEMKENGNLSQLNGTSLEYEYNDGISSKRPEDIPISILQYRNYEDNVLGLTPQVYYRQVKEKKLDILNKIYSSSEYVFDIPQSKNDISKFINFESTSGQNLDPLNSNPIIGSLTRHNRDYDVKFSKYNIVDNTNALGRLLEKRVFNDNDQLISKVFNEYQPLEYFESNKIGFEQETFSSIKKVHTYEQDYDDRLFGSGWETTWYGKNFYLMSSSKKIYPSVLKSTINIEKNFNVKTTFDKYDFLTGQVLETRTYASDGTAFKTKVVPAYTIPEYSGVLDVNSDGIPDGYGMGSKVDNPTNFNMLSQIAASYTLLLNETAVNAGDKERVVSANITTWNNNWNYYDYQGNLQTTTADIGPNIWRKHKNYVWKGNILADGSFEGFNDTTLASDDGFDWGVGVSQSATSNWEKVLETTKYDHYSMVLETKDINDNYASIKMGDKNSKVIVVSNANYGEMFYSGIEYDRVKDENGNSTDYVDGEVKISGDRKTSTETNKAHTGNQYLEVSQGQNAFEVTIPARTDRDTATKQRFKVSVWVKTGQSSNIEILVNDSNPHTFNSDETTIAGDWTLVNGYITVLDTATKVAVRSINGTVHLDDFRLYPASSSMTSYVYNEWDEVSFITGNNGLSTQYIYDKAGRLIETWVEVVTNNTASISGGFKKVSENRYNYKRQ